MDHRRAPFAPRRTRPRLTAAMLTAGVVCAGLAPLFSGCAVSDKDPGSKRSDPLLIFNERLHGPLREIQWNRTGLWEQAEEKPPAYVPRGYPLTAPRTSAAGAWIIDSRDGKRFFIPNRPVNGIQPGAFRNEALDATRWRYEKAVELPDGRR